MTTTASGGRKPPEGQNPSRNFRDSDDGPRPSGGLRPPLAIAAIAVVLIAVAPADACKYSVRDVGFVPMKSVDYGLLYFPEPGEDAAAIERQAQTALAGANVGFRVVDREGEFKRLAWPRSNLMVTGPNDRTSALSYAIKDGKLDVDKLASLIDSPRRREIAVKLPAAFAVVVFVEGDDAAENRRARAAIDRVLEQVTKVMGKLDKAAKEGPALVVIPADQRQAEHWLLWSLGIDDPSRATATFVFGRFRRAAKLFTGPDIDAATMFSPLATLGFSCECDLDRTKLFGPTLLHRWTDADRQRTVSANGFEPDDPLVRAEVNRILAKAPLIEAGELSLTFEGLMLGLKETPLDESDRPPNRSPSAPPSAMSGKHETRPAVVADNVYLDGADRRVLFVAAAFVAVALTLALRQTIRRR